MYAGNRSTRMVASQFASRLADEFNSFFAFCFKGMEDEFLQDLHPEEFTRACAESRISVVLNMREGYDHGYYFISSFIEHHFEYHAKFLK